MSLKADKEEINVAVLLGDHNSKLWYCCRFKSFNLFSKQAIFSIEMCNQMLIHTKAFLPKCIKAERTIPYVTQIDTVTTHYYFLKVAFKEKDFKILGFPTQFLII